MRPAARCRVCPTGRLVGSNQHCDTCYECRCQRPGCNQIAYQNESVQARSLGYNHLTCPKDRKRTPLPSVVRVPERIKHGSKMEYL